MTCSSKFTLHFKFNTNIRGPLNFVFFHMPAATNSDNAVCKHLLMSWTKLLSHTNHCKTVVCQEQSHHRKGNEYIFYLAIFSHYSNIVYCICLDGIGINPSQSAG